MIEDEYRMYMEPAGGIHRACRVDYDGFASIYINDQFHQKQKTALRYEIRYIRRNDLTNGNSIREVGTS